MASAFRASPHVFQLKRQPVTRPATSRQNATSTNAERTSAMTRAQLLDERVDFGTFKGLDDGADVGSPGLQAQVQKITRCNDDRRLRLDGEYFSSQIQA